MKKILTFMMVLLLILTIGCTKTPEAKIMAYYNGEPIYDYEINAFVDMKKLLFEYALSNLEEVKPNVSEETEIANMEYVDYVMYCQYELMQKGFLDYYNLSDEEKKWDYYVSLMRYNYFLEEHGTDTMESILEGNKAEFEYTKNTPGYEKMKQIIKEVADKYNMKFDEFFELVYLDVATDMTLLQSTSTVFIEEHYQGEVYENKNYENIVVSSNIVEEYEGDMQVFWDSTRNYYKYLDDLNSQFYEYLDERAKQEIEFP